MASLPVLSLVAIRITFACPWPRNLLIDTFQAPPKCRTGRALTRLADGACGVFGRPDVHAPFPPRGERCAGTTVAGALVRMSATGCALPLLVFVWCALPLFAWGVWILSRSFGYRLGVSAGWYSRIYLRPTTCIHTCHAYVYAYVHACIHTYIPAYMHTCTHASTHACMHARTHARMHACTHARTHARISAYMNTKIHT